MRPKSNEPVLYPPQSSTPPLEEEKDATNSPISPGSGSEMTQSDKPNKVMQ